MMWRLTASQQGSSSPSADDKHRERSGTMDEEAAGQRPAAKAKAGGKKSDYMRDGSTRDTKKYKDTKPANKGVMGVTLKAVLNLLQRMRDVESVVLDTFIITSDSKVVAVLNTAMAEYDAACKKDGKGHNHGPPHPHMWLILLEALGTLPTTSTEDKAKLEAEFVKYKDTTEGNELAEAVDPTVRLLKVVKTYSSDTKRIVMAAHTNPAYGAVINTLKAAGVKRKTGRAPRGALEEELEAWLEQTFTE